MIAKIWKTSLSVLILAMLGIVIQMQTHYRRNAQFISSLKSVAKQGTERAKVEALVLEKGIKLTPIQGNVSFMEVETGLNDNLWITIVYDDQNHVKTLDISNIDPASKFTRVSFGGFNR